MEERKHSVALDGLRGIAALAVIVLHATSPFGLSPLPNAGLAVDFFFALSGFVVAFAYEDRLVSGRMSFRTFIGVRLARLHPLIIVGVLFGAATYGANYIFLEHGEPIRLVLAVVFGILLIPYGGLAPNNLSSHPLNPPSWSLFAEYLANIGYGIICRRLNTATLAALIVAVTSVECYILINYHSLEVGNTFSDWPLGVARVALPFVAGVALFRLWRTGRFHRLRIPFIALGVALLSVFTADKSVWIDAAAVFIIFPSIIAAGTHGIEQPSLHKFAVWAGKLSYPLYIVHYPMVWVFSTISRILNLSGYTLMALIVMELTFMVILSVVALNFYDEPVRARLAARRSLRL